MPTLNAFWVDQHGATAIEYGLIASLISIAIIVGVGSLGGVVAGMITSITPHIG